MSAHRTVDKSKVAALCANRLISLNIMVPPPELFERAIGYRENERYVALYFDGDDIYYEDCATWDKGNLEPYRLWKEVVPEWRLEIDRAHIDQADKHGARNWLLLDRHLRITRYGPREMIVPILAGQFPLPGRHGRPPWDSIRDEVVIGYTEWYSWLEANNFITPMLS